MTSPALRIVVTGAATGIGRAITEAASQRGAIVWGTFWGPEAEQRAYERELSALGGSVTVRDADVRDGAAVDRLADDAARAMGGIDLWVNSAARLLARPFEATTDADWTDILDSNLLGYVRGCRAAARHMTAGASIINISSITANQPPGNLAAYVTAKGGVDALTRAAAVELAPRGIRVNAVAPGAIDTPLNRESWSDEVTATYTHRAAMGRLGNADEIAAFVLLLASPGASFVTGEVIRADGGLVINGTVGHVASEGRA
jgi:NAD(P)-dependent dehydrogenase (short-subunit alcohol dehydrogenase family)